MKRLIAAEDFTIEVAYDFVEKCKQEIASLEACLENENVFTALRTFDLAEDKCEIIRGSNARSAYLNYRDTASDAFNALRGFMSRGETDFTKFAQLVNNNRDLVAQRAADIKLSGDGAPIEDRLQEALDGVTDPELKEKYLEVLGDYPF